MATIPMKHARGPDWRRLVTLFLFVLACLTGCGAPDPDTSTGPAFDPAQPARPTAGEPLTRGARLGANGSTVMTRRLPRNVPVDFIITPGGYMHPSCVHYLAPGERVMTKKILRADGSVRKSVEDCPYARYDKNGNVVPDDIAPEGGELRATAPAGTPSDLQPLSGWVSDFEADVTAATYLYAEWKVPNDPAVWSDSTTIYLFPSVTWPGRGPLLQPVLGWNAADNQNGHQGLHWSVVSWNCCIDHNGFHGDYVQVWPGQTVTGIVSGQICDMGGRCDYYSVQTYTDPNQRSVLDAYDWGGARWPPMQKVIGGALEEYGVSSCSQIANSRTIGFKRVRVMGPWGQLSPSWYIVNWASGDPRCEQAFAWAMQDGSTGEGFGTLFARPTL